MPRKWNPPAMTTNKEKSINTHVTKTSQPLPAATQGHLTPGLRVGLTRNYKSPKPLHSSLKWTP